MADGASLKGEDVVGAGSSNSQHMPESASPDASQPTPSNEAIVYPPVILPPLTKGWAKGSRREFLTGHIVRFNYRQNQSAADGKEYAAIVVDEYWTRYYWEDSIDEEPTSPPVPPHLDVIHPSKGPLKAAKLAQMNVGIYNWLDYRWKRPQKTATTQDGPAVRVQNAKGKSSEDPFHLLLCNVLGVDVTRTHANTATERWAKDNGDQFKSDLQHEVGGNGRRKIGTSSSVIRTKFAALPEAEQKKYKKLAKDEGKKVCEARAQAILEAGNLLDPTQAQRVIEELPLTLHPFLTKVTEMLGLRRFFYFAGPEPRKGGQINVISMHAGYDKQARPLQFPEANPKAYNKITSLFQNWAETCYTEEEKLSRSLTLPPNLEDAVVESDDDNMTESVSASTGLKRSRTEEPDMIDDDFDKIFDEPPKKKQRGRKKKGSQNSEEGPMSKTSTSKSKAKSKANGKGKHHGKETHQPNATVLHSIGNCVQAPSEPPSHSAGLSNTVQPPAINPVLLEVSNLPPIRTEPITNVPPYQAIYGGIPITGPHNNPNPFSVALDHPDAGLFPCNAPSAPAVPPILPTVPSLPVLPATPSSPVRPAAPSSPALPTMPALPALPLADPPRSPVIDESDAVDSSGVVVFLDQTLWPPWLVLIRDTLEGLELPGPQWKMVLMYMTILEGRDGFQHGTENLPPLLRPPDVHAWIRGGRKTVPHKHMKDVTTAHSNWWAYWKSLQPDWRGIKEVKGLLSHMHRQDDITGDWGELEKRGINGVVSLVTGLGFWGMLCKGGTRRQKDQWDDAVEETKWVFQKMARV